MRNIALAKKLEDYPISLPINYQKALLAIKTPPELKGIAEGMLHNIEALQQTLAGKPLTAMHILGLCIALVSKVAQNRSSQKDILAAMDLMPKYLTVLISNQHACQEAITFFNDEVGEIRSRLR